MLFIRNSWGFLVQVLIHNPGQAILQNPTTLSADIHHLLIARRSRASSHHYSQHSFSKQVVITAYQTHVQIEVNKSSLNCSSLWCWHYRWLKSAAIKATHNLAWRLPGVLGNCKNRNNHPNDNRASHVAQVMEGQMEPDKLFREKWNVKGFGMRTDKL